MYEAERTEFRGEGSSGSGLSAEDFDVDCIDNCVLNLT